MSNAPVKPIPDGMHSLTPHLVCQGAEAAAAFYVKAFGATDMGCMKTPDGKVMHGMVRIGDSALMLVDEFPEMGAKSPKSLGGSPVTIHLYVPDVDATVAQAVAAGATVVMPVADQFWGDRYGQIADPFGHLWSVATHKRDLSEAEMKQEMSKMGGCA